MLSHLKEVYKNKNIIIDLAKNDFKSRYMENYLGILWAFVQPACLIAIFWFVFQIGFKSVAIDDFPFILWLAAAMIPWFFIAECLQSASQSIIGSAFLVKKIVFKTSLLPIIKIISALIIHMFFLVIVLGMFLLYGYEPNIYWLQLIYYLICSIAIMVAISWITSSVVVFFRDLGQIIAMVIQFGFWLTPIFWNLQTVPEKYQFIIKFNPFYYLVEGYRDSLIYHTWFWEHPALSAYFWGLTIIISIVGFITFRKLRPHFADVL
ncbi:ABC transporter permease [Vibrio gazogenes]|uniref:Transport permease protein n=1 Tax=Vibrio gazogenes TaxID=687 RepID=A0A1Z2SFL9_VIBGA|nr:ABC transporter permease [Vibrio gazogenes]ASA55897.1 teichoic acid ABC transporter permease [Vibrio gazogenes]